MAAGADSSPRMVVIERDHELGALRAVLAQGAAGSPCVALITGEPGLGKSYLLRALQGETSGLLLRGYCLEADSPPYFPFRRALARADRDDAIAIAGRTRAILTSAGILSGEIQDDRPAADPLAVRDALTEALLSLSSVAPVVLVLDDMQWASAAAWEAVSYLARALDGAAVSLVLASRPEGVQPPGAGAAAVAELTRNGLLHHLPLRPLSAEGISGFVLQTTRESPAPEFVSLLSSRTGGNPFFLQEVLRGLAEAGQLATSSGRVGLAGPPGASIPIPQTLRLAIWQRVSRLPEATVDALRAAATLGRVFESADVASILAQPEAWAAGWLRQAERAGIASEVAPGQWTFAHDTLRDAVYDEALPLRETLHRAAATVLAAKPGAESQMETAAAIAFHLRAAGDATAAISAALRASRLALASHAADEALRLASLAEETAAAGNDMPPHLGRLDLRRAVAQSAAAAGDYARSELAWTDVLAMTNDPAERARVLVSLGTVVRKAERSDIAAGYFQQALELLDDEMDPRTLVEALVELSTLEGTTRSDYEPALVHSDRAVAIARRLEDGELEARALLALANARARSETPAAARELLGLALSKGLEANDLVVAAEAAASLSNAYYWTGEVRDALAYARQRLEIAERGRDAFALRHAYSWLALLATTVGDWEEARHSIERAGPAIARMGSPEPLGFLRIVEGLLALRTGDIASALDRTAEAMRLLVPLGEATVAWYASIRIWSLIAAGLLSEAADECAAFEARLAKLPANSLPARSARCGLGRAYVALDDSARAADCEALLAPFIDDFHWRPAKLTLAATAAIRGDRDRSLSLLHEVELITAANGLDYDLADARRIRSLLEAGAPASIAFGRPDAAPTAATTPAALPGRLSSREREVLELVASGLSNRDIAERLVLSERTVVNHVSHSFEKIDVDNRAAATAWAFRHGLLHAE